MSSYYRPKRFPREKKHVFPRPIPDATGENRRARNAAFGRRTRWETRGFSTGSRPRINSVSAPIVRRWNVQKRSAITSFISHFEKKKKKNKMKTNISSETNRRVALPPGGLLNSPFSRSRPISACSHRTAQGTACRVPNCKNNKKSLLPNAKLRFATRARRTRAVRDVAEKRFRFRDVYTAAVARTTETVDARKTSYANFKRENRKKKNRA